MGTIIRSGSQIAWGYMTETVLSFLVAGKLKIKNSLDEHAGHPGSLATYN
jgi:hypothetical protein